jgi:hypothetical protein
MGKYYRKFVPGMRHGTRPFAASFFPEMGSNLVLATEILPISGELISAAQRIQ